MLFLLSKSQHIQAFSKIIHHFGETDFKHREIWNFQSIPAYASACLWYSLAERTTWAQLT